MTHWTPGNWQNFSATQLVEYPDVAERDRAIAELSALPPLVTAAEVKRLRHLLSGAAQGRAFILQGGDCAESFAECQAPLLTNKLKILLQMSLILIYGLRKPIIRVGRIAGQYAKPRSSATETRDGVTLPSYRGDLINGDAFTAQARAADPQRMLQGYYRAAATLNYLRALANSGFADLQHPENWDLNFVSHSPFSIQYQKITQSIDDALDFMKTVNALNMNRLQSIDDFFTSHEALHLYYEQALTRRDDSGHWYNLGTHLPWVGLRTATCGGAHIEYLRGIHNPVAVKVGPSTTTESLRDICSALNPDNALNKLIIITRLGADKVTDVLPPLVESVQRAGCNVIWSCDPMHGNTQATSQGIKTRHFDDILSELKQTTATHQKLASYLGGVHFELTGENVTECIGGARGLSETDLHTAYHTLVDPRLNYEQALEMAMLITPL